MFNVKKTTSYRKIQLIWFEFKFIWAILKAKELKRSWAEESIYNCGIITKAFAYKLHLENETTPIPGLIHTLIKMLLGIVARDINSTSIKYEVTNLSVGEVKYGDWVVRIEQVKKNKEIKGEV